MMSISVIAPAFASPPWKDLYVCEGDVGPVYGSFKYVTQAPNNCDLELDNRETCPTKRGTGHVEFKDLNPYNGAYDYPDEQTRCHKN